MTHWIKLYTEILQDPKMGRLTDSQYRTCINVFLMAGAEEKDGEIGTTDDVAWTLRLDSATCADNLAVLEELGIVEQTDGAWRVTHFPDRQARKPSDHPERVRERVAKTRECNAPVTRYTEDVTPVYRPVSPIEKNRIEENREEQKQKDTEVSASAAVEPSLDKDFGAVWSVYAFENLVNPSSLTQQEDIADMVKRCRDPDKHREAIKRARRLSTRPSLNLVFKILNDYIETGSWEKPGGNGHGPPGKRSASRESDYSKIQASAPVEPYVPMTPEEKATRERELAAMGLL